MGTNASMDWWPEELCERLAAGPRFVVRYDHRDTGRSVSYEPGSPEYTGGDLLADALGLLDVLGIGSAHLVGMSMGGALAQLVALDHPDRVTSLTLISTAPAVPATQDRDLPGMAEETIREFGEVSEPDWSDRAAVINYGVELARISAARSVPFDAMSMRELWGRAFDRTTNVESTFKNHDLLESAEAPRGHLDELTVPTLVIHGTEDPVLPYGNGEALASEIPGAELLRLEATGHELPRRDWDVVVPAILRHTASA
jgi:pimeloyl-ACP methyl ester carboxylesterase